MLMARLKEHDFFKRPIPRSAWRLDFGSSYLDRQMEEFSHLSTEDLLETLTEFAAYAITRSITDNVKMLSEISVIMASGRGTRNHYLMSRLREYMPKGLRLTTSDESGVPAQFREAIKFATLAYATVNQLANNIPAASGATRFGILGKLVQPPRLCKGSNRICGLRSRANLALMEDRRKDRLTARRPQLSGGEPPGERHG
jgi:anhydro-N-acetylmuramic acid kinase